MEYSTKEALIKLFSKKHPLFKERSRDSRFRTWNWRNRNGQLKEKAAEHILKRYGFQIAQQKKWKETISANSLRI